MSTFKLLYKNGSTEVVQTDAKDVADQINRTFGLSVEEAKEMGVDVIMLSENPEDLLQALVEEVVEHPHGGPLLAADGTEVPNPFAKSEEATLNLSQDGADTNIVIDVTVPPKV